MSNRSNITLSSNCVNVPHNLRLYTNEQERVANRVPSSTATHNAVCALSVSRRKKVRFTADNQLDRKNKVRERLLKKIAAKKKAKSSE
jgi:hypothetical protein